jgi:hypothetical protein
MMDTETSMKDLTNMATHLPHAEKRVTITPSSLYKMADGVLVETNMACLRTNTH